MPEDLIEKDRGERSALTPPIDYQAAELELRIACLRHGIRRPERFLPFRGKSSVTLGYRFIDGDHVAIVFDCRTRTTVGKITATKAEFARVLVKGPANSN